MFGKKKLLLQLELENKFIYQITSDEIDHTFLIGRDRLCDWRIPATDRSASNRHAELFIRRGKVFLRDLNSHNGVFFLGEKITERALSPGERYGIGDSVLVVSQVEENKAEKNKNKYHRLEQLNGKNRKKVYELSGDEYIIGSAYDADIRIEDNMVSQHHAKLEIKKDGSCWITDLGSRNGTSVNRMALSAENIEGRMLQHRDILSIVSVDFFFYDKSVAVQKSYFLLKTLCAIATIVILLSAYFFWQSLMPSSKQYIERARKYAEIKQFDTALVLLDKAADAPKAAVYKAECIDLRNQIESWKNTIEKWNEARKMILESRWISGNKIIVGLVVAKNDIWNWNDSDAIESKRQAHLTAEVLEPFLHSRILLAMPETSISALEADLLKLNNALKSIAGQSADHFQLLYKEGKIVAEELNYVIANLKTIERTVTNINVERQLVTEITVLRKIHQEALFRSQQQDKIDRRLTAKLVQERCKLYLPPLEALSIGQKQFYANQSMLASLEFGRLNKVLSLPSAELCAVAPIFTTMRNELVHRNTILLQRGKQLEFLINTLRTSGIIYSKQPDILKKWQQKSFLPMLLTCDCFRYDAKSWSPHRKSPVGEYDRFLGIEYFWDFLRDLPEKYDAALLDDRPFVPEIAQIRKIYSDLDIFRNYMEDPIIALLLGLDVKNPRLQNLALWVDELLTARDNTINTFVNYSRTTTNMREALIAGGAALLLDNGKNNIFAGEYDRLVKILKKLRKETSHISNLDVVPEQVIKNRRKIVSIGLPGDPAVRQAFNDMSEEKK